MGIDDDEIIICWNLEEIELHRLVRSSRPDRLDDRWLNKCRHLFMATLRQSTHDAVPLSRMFFFGSIHSTLTHSSHSHG